MSFNVIGLRGGHSKNCQGANYLRNEYYCMQELYKAVRDKFLLRGLTVIDCNSNANTEGGELSEGANKANLNKVDIFISLHMNAVDSHRAYGTEVWVTTGSKIMNEAINVVNNLSALGWFNRGVKESSSLYECRHVNAPNMLVEVCFCDNQTDIDVWSPTSYGTMAEAIVNGILGKQTIDTVKYTHYALEQVNIIDSNGNITGALWKDEQFQVKWIDNNYHVYVKYWNSDKTKTKEGYVEFGKESLVFEIGKEPPVKPKVLYKVQVGAYENKENAENLLNDLKAKGYSGYIVEV